MLPTALAENIVDAFDTLEDMAPIASADERLQIVRSMVAACDWSTPSTPNHFVLPNLFFQNVGTKNVANCET